MLTTTYNSIVFPETLPEEFIFFFNQLLLSNVNLLLLRNEINLLDQQYKLEETKNIIEKRRKDFLIEKRLYEDEGIKIKRKKQKIDLSFGNTLSDLAKIYKPEYSDSEAIQAVMKLLNIYNSKNKDGITKSINLFDESKDNLYELTPEQINFLNFSRSQDRAKKYYENKLEIIINAEKHNSDIKKFKEEVQIFNQAVLNPHIKASDNYNQLKNKFEDINSQKEKIFDDFFKKTDNSVLQEQIKDLVNFNFEANKMLPTENNSIVFPVTISEEAMKCLRQMLAIDIERLFYKHTSEFKKKTLDEKKDEIIKKERELLIEKTHLKSEIEKINKKQNKIDIALMHFLSNSLKLYKPKNNSIDKVKMSTQLLSAYRDEGGSMNTIDLFDESKDEVYEFTEEQKDFLNFARTQHEIKIHYANKLENNKKGKEFEEKLEDYIKRYNKFKEVIYNPYDKLFKDYQTMKEKVDALNTRKDQLFQDFLKMMENDSTLQEQLEQILTDINDQQAL